MASARLRLPGIDTEMGLDFECYEFVARAHAGGAAFDSVLTVGRQELIDATRVFGDLRRRGFSPVGRPPSPSEKGYAEWVFEAMGAKTIDSADASAYEGATIIQDLNDPIPADLHAAYDVVIDGGTLEHVFNFPVALANCMNLVRPGGRVFFFTPANNSVGHGFYQFAPELFYRALSPDNGFRVERLLLQPLGFPRCPYRVADPADVGERVMLINSSPARLFVQAVRIGNRPAFTSWPQQSDQVQTWRDRPAKARGWRAVERAVFWTVFTRLPGSLRDALYATYFRYRKYNLRNRRFFIPTSIG